MQSLPPSLLAKAVNRLRVVSLFFAALFTVGWLFKGFFEGTLAVEFQFPGQWAPPVLVIASSLVMFALSLLPWFSMATLARIGLVYAVAVAFGLAGSQYVGAFSGIEPKYVIFDRVGVSLVGVWMVFFTIVVPNRPRDAALALIAAGSAVPCTYALSVHADRAPALEPTQFFFVFVFPYVICAAMGYFGAVIIYRLGRDLRRAQEMGSYWLEDLLGRGGMGEVWRARHRMLARPAAVKLIRPEAIGRDAFDSAEQRFEQEAQVTAGLQSPHTVQLYDFGTSEDGALYYVMELLDGMDLQTLVERYGPLAPERVVHILRQACASLGEAHSLGLVHRDIKPSNLFLCRYAMQFDFVKVLDFGLVKRHSTLDTGVSMTRAGVVTGTPSFIAPELALASKDVDGRADLYALGCVAYWLLTGRLVFDEDSAVAMVVAHANTPPTPPSARTELAIPDALDALVLRCLAKDPADRPQTAEELARDLDGIEPQSPWSNHRAAQWWAAHRPPTPSAG